MDELLEEVEGEIEVLLSRQAELQAKKEKLLRLVQQEQRAPQADWKHGSFSWDSAVQEKLHKVFGIPGFRQVHISPQIPARPGRPNGSLDLDTPRSQPDLVVRMGQSHLSRSRSRVMIPLCFLHRAQHNEVYLLGGTYAF